MLCPMHYVLSVMFSVLEVEREREREREEYLLVPARLVSAGE